MHSSSPAAMGHVVVKCKARPERDLRRFGEQSAVNKRMNVLWLEKMVRAR